jgi:carbonic anhydrase
VTTTDRWLTHAARHADSFETGGLSPRPVKQVAIVACMDARLDIFSLFGLEIGDAHIIRNAGGTVTDDVLRSLAISQRLLGTHEVILVHHTDCGMLVLDEDKLAAQIEEETGERPPFRFLAFSDLEADVRASIGRVNGCLALAEREAVRGFVYDVETGVLSEVVPNDT